MHLSALRVVVTVVTLAGLAYSATASVRRFGGAVLRQQANRLFNDGQLEAAFDTFERARAWDAAAPTADTDPGDTAAWALDSTLGPDVERPSEPRRLAAAGIAAYLRAIAEAPPGSWSWAGVARIYQGLREDRLRSEGMDLSRLTADPLENLLPEDRLAEAALLEALRAEPRNYFHLDSLGELYWSRGLRDRALLPFRRAVEIYPLLQGHYYIGERLAESAELADAVRAGLETATASVGARERWVIAREIGLLEVRLRRPEAALPRFGQALELAAASEVRARDLAKLHHYRAEALQRMGQYDAAVVEMRESVRLESDRALYHAVLGSLLGRLDRHEEAMASLAAARGLAPEDARIIDLMARECERAGDVEGAERAFKELIRLDPERVDPYLRVIEMLRRADLEPRALPYARELARLHPDERLYRRQLEQLRSAGLEP